MAAALPATIALVCWDHLETGGVLFCRALRIRAAQGILDISRAGQAHDDLCIGTGTFDVEMNGVLDNFLDAFSDDFQSPPTSQSFLRLHVMSQPATNPRHFQYMFNTLLSLAS